MVIVNSLLQHSLKQPTVSLSVHIFSCLILITLTVFISFYLILFLEAAAEDKPRTY